MFKSSRIHQLILIVISLSVFNVGCSQSPSSDPVTSSADNGMDPDGHDRMLRDLEGIAARTSTNNPYIGRTPIDELQHELETKSAAGLLSLESRVSLLSALGFHKLRIGENAEAISGLESAYRLWKEYPSQIPTELADTLLMMLTVAHLRVGETENCVYCETGQNCIFPFQQEAIHTRLSGSQNARVYLEELLSRNPEDLTARWLLNLTAMTLGEHPEQLSREALIDQDVVISLGGAFGADRFKNAVFENTTPIDEQNHWIAIRLVGVTSNRSAIGSRIRAVVEENGRERSIYRWVNSGGSFGANPLRQQIGLGRASRIKVLEIDWPSSGIQQKFEDIEAGQFLEIREDSSQFQVLPWKQTPFPAPKNS